MSPRRLPSRSAPMKPALALLALALVAPALRAQRLGQDPISGTLFVLVEGSAGVEAQTFEEYFGEDANVMRRAAEVALENEPFDGFRWHKKDDDLATAVLEGGKVTNACAIASENLIDDVKAQRVLPEGWDIRQIGRLGNLTDAENWAADVFIDWFSNTNKDRLDPPSYDHTLSVIRSPSGNYYTIDNWKNGVSFKKVYALDLDDPNDPKDTPIFFTTDPNETDIFNAEFRVQRTAWGYDPDNRPDPPEKSRDRSPIPRVSNSAEVEVLTSADPNDKLGLRGVGADRFITPALPLDYVIRFENKPDASAPAQEVLVRDTLDLAVVDPATFSLGDVRFGDRRIEVPPGLRSFATRVPLAGGRLVLLVDANLVEQTGVVTWRFTTLDPATNDLPLDPLDGFLPPNRTSPEGEGSVAFSVGLRAGLPTATRVVNQARIVFDLNEPIDTPPWANTLDLAPPTSRVTDLGAVQSTGAFEVAWAGADGGSGVDIYDVYLSVNGGPFAVWQQGTPATRAAFAGQNDSTYAFFSVAYDATGNAEPMKAAAEATTRVVVSAEDAAADVPAAFALHAGQPNPFAERAAIPYDVREEAHVRLEVFDLTGRRVATLVDARRAPGRYTATLDAGPLAPGVYVYRVEMGGFRAVRKLVRVR